MNTVDALKNNSAFRSHYRLLLLLALCWGIPGLWIIAIPSASNAYNAKNVTTGKLMDVEEHLKIFFKKYQRYPFNLNELRVFALSEHREIDLYDRYGQHLSYAPLSYNQYLLRSFGADADQNTLDSDADLAITSESNLHATGVDVYRRKTSALVFPAAMLLGCKSDSITASASLFVNHLLNQRTLAVSALSNGSNYYMTAPHDRVEEFFWVPKKAAIVFSGTNSLTHADGIYYWDLKTNDINPLFTAGDKLPGRTTTQNKQLWLNLVAINEIDDTLYAFIKPVEPKLLSPADFYHPSNLWVVNFKEGTIYPSFINDSKVLQGLTLNHTLVKQRDALLNPASQPSSLQQQWLNLPLEGNAEDVLMSWTNYCGSEVHTTALFPYCLWYLAEIYHQAYAHLLKHNKNKADSLRAFGAEISEKLASAPMAPMYLNSFGHYLYRSFIDKTAQQVELIKFDWQEE